MGLGVSEIRWEMVIPLLIMGVGWWIIFGWGVNKAFRTMFAPWKKRKRSAH